MAVPEDSMRYLLGLEGGRDCIRVRRADMISVARAREAHAQAVIAAWMQARPIPGPPLTESRWTRLRRRAAAAQRRFL
jgi:hypothetical protein